VCISALILAKPLKRHDEEKNMRWEAFVFSLRNFAFTHKEHNRFSRDRKVSRIA